MKVIIVPADFSPASETAIAYAVGLAQAANASVLLLHVYQMPVTMNDFPVLMVSAEDLKKTADTGLAGAMEEAQKKFPQAHFETESRLGDSEEETEAVAKERDALCIVTGTQKLSGLENFLLGNDALSLAKACRHPVLVVHEGLEINAPKNIVLAIDLEHIDEVPVQTISAFVQALKAQLHIVHVATEDEKNTSLQYLMDKFAGVPMSYHAVQSHEVSEGIKMYLSQSRADLLMLLPHKHNFIERVFSRGHAAEIMAGVSLPVVCINE